MAFSFLKNLMDVVTGEAERRRRVESGEAAALAAANLAGEGVPLSEEELAEERLFEDTRNLEDANEKASAEPADLKEGFLYYGRWLFASKSHHVSAMKYDRDTMTLTAQYKRGDQWSYDPISPVLAAKFADDLLGGSPGTDVWDYLRWRPSEGAPDMRSHRAGIRAVRVA